MSRLLKSRDYFMKCLGFVLLLGFISFGAIVGCNNNGGGGSSQDTQALTERDFSNNPNLSAKPEEGVVVDFLEPAEAPEEENLTGEPGFDEIPYRYTRTLNHTFCWEDDDGDAEHFMELEDSDGNEILKIDVNGECVTEVIEAGDYVMIIHHDGKKEKTHPVFIIPGRSGGQQAQRIDTNQRLLKSEKNIYARLINNLNSIITPKANAQTPTPAENLTTLLNTNACQECNLVGVDLSRVDLSGADLREAILFEADLFLANLSDANLSEVCLTAAVLRGADLSGANLSDASLSEICPVGGGESIGADVSADLSGADLSGANLSEADLSSVDLSAANLTDVTLDDTIFTSALWCDGLCICGSNSIDTCVGCASIDTCT